MQGIAIPQGAPWCFVKIACPSFMRVANASRAIVISVLIILLMIVDALLTSQRHETSMMITVRAARAMDV